jgi:hypothetical protein
MTRLLVLLALLAAAFLRRRGQRIPTAAEIAAMDELERIGMTARVKAALRRPEPNSGHWR